MSSNHVRWSQLPASEDLDGEGPSVRIRGSGVESLDYEVIENFAYREEQVYLITRQRFYWKVITVIFC